jgi:hypothetical protein
VNLKISQSERSEETDKQIEFNYPYHDHYEDIDVFTTLDMTYSTTNLPKLIANNTMDPVNKSNWLTGYNLHNPALQEFNFALTGNINSPHDLQINAVRCR